MGFLVPELIFIFASPSEITPEGRLERCLSGRKGRFAKPLYELKLVSRVRIPPSPLNYEMGRIELIYTRIFPFLLD